MLLPIPTHHSTGRFDRPRYEKHLARNPIKRCSIGKLGGLTVSGTRSTCPRRCRYQTTKVMTKLAKRMNMNCYPTTSGISHLLEGVFLGVSLPTRIQKLNKLPVLSASFGFRP
jgi:hypothetical protein